MIVGMLLQKNNMIMAYFYFRDRWWQLIIVSDCDCLTNQKMIWQCCIKKTNPKEWKILAYNSNKKPLADIIEVAIKINSSLFDINKEWSNASDSISKESEELNWYFASSYQSIRNQFIKNWTDLNITLFKFSLKFMLLLV